MKKKLTYRDQLLELAEIYGVKEIQEYIRRRKSLTTGQLELILKKNKIVIPKEFKTTFFKENFTKPIARVARKIDDIKYDSSRAVNKASRRISYFKEDSSRSINAFFLNLWKSVGNTSLGILNVLPKLGITVYNFIGATLVNLFHGIYDQKIYPNKTNKVILSFFVITGLAIITFAGVTKFSEPNKIKKEVVIKKDEPQKEPKKIETIKPKKEDKKIAKKPEVKPKNKNKQDKSKELLLPDLNLKTETVLNFFKDENYDLNKVRFEKKVKPIYFTQFPKDLDAIQSVKIKKETFIKIVLPLIVAENEKIIDDRKKLLKIVSKKATTDDEKQWLRQKFLEYKVKNGKVEILKTRMDIIPVSIALAQAAKESGWGTSRFALEGNAIFGQWTWDGKGIAPLMRDKSKNHKILKFPILRASVKAYQKNLNTHKSYIKFRETRKKLREKNKTISGLELTKTLDNYAETGSEYTKILSKIIVQNRLMDFETVRLTSSSKKKEVNL